MRPAGPGLEGTRSPPFGSGADTPEHARADDDGQLLRRNGYGDAYFTRRRGFRPFGHAGALTFPP